MSINSKSVEEVKKLINNAWVAADNLHKENIDISNLYEKAKDIANWREKQGFFTPNTISKNNGFVGTHADAMLGKLFLVQTEISEAGEAIRAGNFDNFREEIADALIRLLDICGTMGIDPMYEINKKMEVNKQRPFRHGKETTL